MKKNRYVAMLSALLFCLAAGCGADNGDENSFRENVSPEESGREEAAGETREVTEPEEGAENGTNRQGKGEDPVQSKGIYTADTKIADVMSDEIFGNYGRLIFPADSGYYSGETLGELQLTWYNNIDAGKTVEIANYMRNHAEAGETIFYDIYTEEEKAADPEKEDTGLFFFKGNPGEKFAVCNAGGGFAYVGAMHDSFPHALELSKKGYNAFALIYRPGAQTACEDLARAISFIFAHAGELEVDTDCYSLWGGSAGARMAAWLGSYGPAEFGGDSLPQAGAVMMQYTGHTDYTENDPPTYVCVGENDWIADWQTMKGRLDRLSALGIDTEFHSYPGLGHGFGLGTGTLAEGWFEDAVAFWERQMEPESVSGRIPEELLSIPDAYHSPASEQGRVEKLEYTTYESMSYEDRTKQLTKTAYVYLPYGYSEDKKYNVFYLMHGGWNNETAYLGTAENPSVFKDVIDHAIQDGQMEPMLIVCPTYNNESSSDSDNYSLSLRLTDNYHKELVNDLLPAVEGRYSTYAESTSEQDLISSRDHRGFGGFSMGSVTTWHTFQYCLDYFRYFTPSSGDLTSDGQFMDSIVKESGYGADDFFIYAMTGTEDFDYAAFTNQIQAMLAVPDGSFIAANREQDGNLAFRVQEGASHDYDAATQYIYNGLVWLWSGSDEP